MNFPEAGRWPARRWNWAEPRPGREREREQQTDAGAADPEPMQEPVGTWFFERNTWAEHNLGNPSRSKGAVTETYAIVGCSDHIECDLN